MIAFPPARYTVTFRHREPKQMTVHTLSSFRLLPLAEFYAKCCGGFVYDNVAAKIIAAYEVSFEGGLRK